MDSLFFSCPGGGAKPYYCRQLKGAACGTGGGSGRKTLTFRTMLQEHPVHLLPTRSSLAGTGIAHSNTDPARRSPTEASSEHELRPLPAPPPGCSAPDVSLFLPSPFGALKKDGGTLRTPPFLTEHGS